MKLSRRSVTDVSLLVLVNAMWAAQYAAYKVASQAMGPVTLSAWTFLFAGIILLPFLLWERRRMGRGEAFAGPAGIALAPGGRLLFSKRNLIGFLMIGVVGLIPASVFLAWGVSRSSASDAALIYLTVPIITALLASLILKERMTWVRWGSLFLALVGVLIMSNVDWRHVGLTSSKFLTGNLLVLAACASSSFYNVYCKELLSRFTPLEVLVIGYFLAVALSIPLMGEIEGFSLQAVCSYQATAWLALIVLSALSWGLAMVLWMFLLKRLDVSQASVSIYLLPFLGVLISAA
ncbi:MAG TPA: DMT family transporter, partial [Terriglobia bacterium]|nr:DMT family transporter [Terriglobia bacterium]